MLLLGWITLLIVLSPKERAHALTNVIIPPEKHFILPLTTAKNNPLISGVIQCSEHLRMQEETD